MEDLPKDLYAPGLKVFVCSVDKDLQRKVVDACDTLSTSLGPVRRENLLYSTPHVTFVALSNDEMTRLPYNGSLKSCTSSLYNTAVLVLLQYIYRYSTELEVYYYTILHRCKHSTGIELFILLLS